MNLDEKINKLEQELKVLSTIVSELILKLELLEERLMSIRFGEENEDN